VVRRGRCWPSCSSTAAAELTQRQPYSEAATELSMRYAITDGRRVQAILAYEDLRTRLRDDVGLVPGARLRALHADLQTDDQPAEPPRRVTHLPRETRP
jgi:DNA-binding SARP family transcriptional activator